jgi:hypothetical protein
MTKIYSVTSFLNRFSQIRDELAAVGEIVDPSNLVRITLNGFSKPWDDRFKWLLQSSDREEVRKIRK